MFCPFVFFETLFKWHLALLATSWVLRAIFQILFESCPDLPVPAVEPPGAPILICACSLHARCLGIFLSTGLGLEASCRLPLDVVYLCWAWSIHPS